MVSPIQHGGNQYAIRKRLKLGDLPLRDFSVSLNPLGPPRRAVAAARRALKRTGQYPEPGNPRLVEALAERHNVPADRVIVGAGTTELINLLAQGLRESLNRRAQEAGDAEMPLAHLFEPCYGEYRRSSFLNELRPKTWGLPFIGWELDFFPPAGSTGIFWTGCPHSPVGRCWEREKFLRKVDDNPDLMVVVDEAYISFLPDEADRTVVRAASQRANLFALRSVTKIFAMPGLRVGYAIGSADLVARLREFQNPWSVDSASEAALISALRDDEYLEHTLDLIPPEAARFTDRLWDVRGVRPVWPARRRPVDAPPPPNWVLVSLVDTPFTSNQVQDELARRGFFVRECSNFQGLEIGSTIRGIDESFTTNGHLRFAVRTPEENDRLADALESILSASPQVRRSKAAFRRRAHGSRKHVVRDLRDGFIRRLREARISAAVEKSRRRIG